MAVVSSCQTRIKAMRAPLVSGLPTIKYLKNSLNGCRMRKLWVLCLFVCAITACSECKNRKKAVPCDRCTSFCCKQHYKSAKMYICSQCIQLPKSQIEFRAKRGRCYICCSGGARAMDKKTSSCCHNCVKVVCKKHRTEVTRNLCTTCYGIFKRHNEWII